MYLLHASDRTVWHRITAWLSSINTRRPDRKEALRRGWEEEIAAFRASFRNSNSNPTAGEESLEDYGLFVGVASSALLRPPDEEAGRRLWSILDSKVLYW